MDHGAEMESHVDLLWRRVRLQAEECADGN